MSALAPWIDQAWRIERARFSRRRYERIDEHWAALSIDEIKRAGDREELAGVMRVAEWLGLKPRRGHRRGTKWELVNMAVRNRIWQLDRAADLAQIPAGNNWERAA